MSGRQKGRLENGQTTVSGQAQKQPPQNSYDEFEEYEEYQEELRPRREERREAGTSAAQQRERALQASRKQPSSRNVQPRGDRNHEHYHKPSRDHGHYYEPPRRDVFPYVMGALIGAMVMGLITVAFLLISSGKPSAGQTSGSSNAGSAQSVATLAPSSNSLGGTGGTGGTGGSAGQDPPRMALADFTKLYDDPAKRPLIIDVRTADLYAQGHIKGAVSFPVAEVDARAGELPKNKLVVAYCQ